jgi:DNA (cytosine-5)-methyltransferase 1
MRPRLLDLFCGAGGAAMGYHRAGFDVVGVDIVDQPHFPFEFRRGNAMTYPFDGFDVIHASPPCKRFTVARAVTVATRPTLFDPHPDLLTPTRERLRAHGAPYVIENVPGAPMAGDAVVCCGSAFGLGVRRHRLFESNTVLRGSGCYHDQQPEPVGVYGTGGAWTRTAPGGGGRKVAGTEAAAALGVDWTTHQPALSQAIPPAYTEHIGGYMMGAVRARAAET